jgi:hypothetical protein
VRKLVPAIALLLVEFTRDKRMLATTATDGNEASLDI